MVSIIEARIDELKRSRISSAHSALPGAAAHVLDAPATAPEGCSPLMAMSHKADQLEMAAVERKEMLPQDPDSVRRKKHDHSQEKSEVRLHRPQVCPKRLRKLNQAVSTSSNCTSTTPRLSDPASPEVTVPSAPFNLSICA